MGCDFVVVVACEVCGVRCGTQMKICDGLPFFLVKPVENGKCIQSCGLQYVTECLFPHMHSAVVIAAGRNDCSHCVAVDMMYAIPLNERGNKAPYKKYKYKTM